MVYTKRLAGPAYAPNAIAAIGTVPTGKVWVIMSLFCRNTDTVARSCGFYVGTVSLNNKLLFTFLNTAANSMSWLIEPRIVLTAGEVLAAESFVTDKVVYGVHGYELDAP